VPPIGYIFPFAHVVGILFFVVFFSLAMRLPIWIRNGVIALVGLLLMYHAVLYASNLIEEADIVLAPNQTVVVRPTKHVSTPNHNQTPLATNINVQHKEPKFAIMTAIGTGDYQEQIAPFSVNNKKSYAF
jgi:xanthosine utilization system XapX-like protein